MRALKISTNSTNVGKDFCYILKNSRAAAGVKHLKDDTSIQHLKKTALVRSKGGFTKMAVVFPVMSDF